MQTKFWYQEAHDSASNNSPTIGGNLHYGHTLILSIELGFFKLDVRFLWFAFGFTIGFSHHAYIDHLVDDRD